ncbi:MAG TPA: DUF3467 domain-containing protein [Phycisphaerales bacterium]|nr:DUF3467 domain-containing protein [Phycisphaerales bacterium]
MTDQTRGQQGQPIQIRMDESKTVTTYANTIRTVPGQDEIILDFGLNLPVPTNPGEQMTMQFSVGSRVVMNWTAAKRLQMSLQQAVGAYEQNYGPIEVTPPPRQNK